VEERIQEEAGCLIKMLQGTCGKQETHKCLSKKRNIPCTKSLWAVEKRMGKTTYQTIPEIWCWEFGASLQCPYHLLTLLPHNSNVFPTMSLISGAPIDPTIYLSKTASNVISSIVFGDRFNYEDKEFLSLLQMMGQVNKFAASPTGQVRDSSSANCTCSVPHWPYPAKARTTSTLIPTNIRSPQNQSLPSDN
jgi:hypothetical protein